MNRWWLLLVVPVSFVAGIVSAILYAMYLVTYGNT